MPQVAPGIYYPDPYWIQPGRVISGRVAIFPQSPFFGGVPSTPLPQMVNVTTGSTVNMVQSSKGFGPGIGRSGSPPLASSATTGLVLSKTTLVPR